MNKRGIDLDKGGGLGLESRGENNRPFGCALKGRKSTGGKEDQESMGKEKETGGQGIENQSPR
jgi:hypothetical protein